METGDSVRIVDDSFLPAEYSRLHKHYKNGTIATIKSVFYGFFELEVSRQVSTLILAEENLKAIEVIS